MERSSALNSSTLFDETTFYRKFLHDLDCCEKEVVIESPFITDYRMKMLIPFFQKLVDKGVKVYILTRDPREHDEGIELQSEDAIRALEVMGVQVLLCVGNHHRKLAILDRNILWEGSLNILSQAHSREIMRRIESKELAMDMFNFLKLAKFL